MATRAVNEILQHRKAAASHKDVLESHKADIEFHERAAKALEKDLKPAERKELEELTKATEEAKPKQG